MILESLYGKMDRCSIPQDGSGFKSLDLSPEAAISSYSVSEQDQTVLFDRQGRRAHHNHNTRE